MNRLKINWQSLCRERVILIWFTFPHRHAHSRHLDQVWESSSEAFSDYELEDFNVFKVSSAHVSEQ